MCGAPETTTPGRRRRDAAGRLRLHVRLPVLPNGRTGWIQREALGGYSVVRTHLVVDLDELTATLPHIRRPVFSARIGVGQSAWPTPRGQFYIRNRLTSYESPFYGPLAFGTSARSAVLTDWPDGGFVGIHGTNQPELLPGRVSHGCIRMRNEDILALGRLMPIGTPVTIR
jgi:L,D-transpeptidase catalytic domain